ncbi:hypothetical protein THITH_02270 [Thioalkalivibrio paradoxus ARh 1]|uniref:Type IV pilus assembly protein PilW n=2 Tax=Thioalkalivibrio paradoxus TaxID=108010 RepID=W0DSB2_9GAMM|nr:hypothetical protein THITH_02270 [Thioalkalivibrio paradoxus ARh 1]
MVGIVVGLIVIAGVLAIFLVTLTGSNHTVREARLNQELRVAMDFIVNDLKRAGFWGHAGRIRVGSDAMPDNPNPFTNRDSTAGGIRDVNILSDRTCIMFSYEPTFEAMDPPPPPWRWTTADEYFLTDSDSPWVYGYRLSNDEIQMLDDTTVKQTTTCPGNANWISLTDRDVVAVDDLRFSTTGSRCFNATAVDADDNHHEWSITTADSVTPACIDSVASGYEVNDGDILAESRRINVLIEGHHVTDPDATLELVESVKIRNNRIYRHRDP